MSKQYTDNETAPLALHVLAQGLVNSLWKEARQWRERAEVAEATVAAMRTVMENEHNATTNRLVREYATRMREE